MSLGSGPQGSQCVQGRQGLCFLEVGAYKPRLQHPAVPQQMDALQQEAPGLFLTLLLFLGAFGLQDCFLCCLSLLCLSPLTGVNNGVNEAGGDRSGCCRAAHSRCGGKCVHRSVGCSGATLGALGPSSGFIVDPQFRGAALNSLAPLCHLFLEVTCSMGCQQVVLYLH